MAATIERETDCEMDDPRCYNYARVEALPECDACLAWIERKMACLRERDAAMADKSVRNSSGKVKV